MFGFVGKLFSRSIFSACQSFELGPRSKLLAAERHHPWRHDFCLTSIERVNGNSESLLMSPNCLKSHQNSKNYQFVGKFETLKSFFGSLTLSILRKSKKKLYWDRLKRYVGIKNFLLNPLMAMVNHFSCLQTAWKVIRTVKTTSFKAKSRFQSRFLAR